MHFTMCTEDDQALKACKVSCRFDLMHVIIAAHYPAEGIQSGGTPSHSLGQGLFGAGAA